MHLRKHQIKFSLAGDVFCNPKRWNYSVHLREGQPILSKYFNKNNLRQLQQVCVKPYLFHHKLERFGVSPLEFMQFGLEGGKNVLNDPFNLLTVKSATVKFTLIVYL